MLAINDKTIDSLMNKGKEVKNKFCQMRNIIIFFIVLIPFGKAGEIYSQITSRQDKQLLLKADKAFDYGDYLGALKMYESLYPLDSNDIETNYKLGVCNYEIKKYRKNAKK